MCDEDLHFTFRDQLSVTNSYSIYLILTISYLGGIAKIENFFSNFDLFHCRIFLYYSSITSFRIILIIKDNYSLFRVLLSEWFFEVDTLRIMIDIDNDLILGNTGHCIWGEIGRKDFFRVKPMFLSHGD